SGGGRERGRVAEGDERGGRAVRLARQRAGPCLGAPVGACVAPRPPPLPAPAARGAGGGGGGARGGGGGGGAAVARPVDGAPRGRRVPSRRSGRSGVALRWRICCGGRSGWRCRASAPSRGA